MTEFLNCYGYMNFESSYTLAILIFTKNDCFVSSGSLVEILENRIPMILMGQGNDNFMGQIPRRYPYPTSEQIINGEQYQIVHKRIDRKDNRSVKNCWYTYPDPIKEHPEEVVWMVKPCR